ncbi:hypothetical protein MCHK_11965 (plasmid) [Mesorhizobium huakuii 7653R]|nr:hypothetical protein MCHK_11965 [Mesorhizobium huakuii 7653R]
MPIRLEILDYVSLKEVRHLTYPAVWSVVTSRFASTVRGVAARTTDVTAGLALAVPGPSGQFELLSVYVLPMLRLAHWSADHFVVVEGRSGRGVRINDPALGRRIVGHEEFYENYSGVALEFKRGPDFKPGGYRQGMLRTLFRWTSGSRAALVVMAATTVMPDLNTACENMSLSQHVRRAPARVTTTFWGDLRRVVRRGCVAERCQLP